MTNTLSNRSRTLGELMTDLRVRLGFAIEGGASSANERLMLTFLQEGHDYVYGELQPAAQRKRCVLQILKGSYLYDWHNDDEDEPIDPADLIGMWLVTEDGLRQRLLQRDVYSGSPDQEEGDPTSYSTLNGQIELHPIPSGDCKLELEYLAGKNRFAQPADRPSVPDRLVFQYALANAKAHFRHPDSQAAGSSFQAMLSKAKMAQKENRRYFAGCSAGAQDPQVVRSANGKYYLQQG